MGLSAALDLGIQKAQMAPYTTMSLRRLKSCEITPLARSGIAEIRTSITFTLPNRNTGFSHALSLLEKEARRSVSGP